MVTCEETSRYQFLESVAFIKQKTDYAKINLVMDFLISFFCSYKSSQALYHAT